MEKRDNNKTKRRKESIKQGKKHQQNLIQFKMTDQTSDEKQQNAKKPDRRMSLDIRASKKEKQRIAESNFNSNSFIYSSSSSGEDEEDEENTSGNNQSQIELSQKLQALNLRADLPEFVKHIKKPRRLTFGEIRSLHVSEKFVHDAHKMIFYPPNMAFAPL